MNKTKQKNTKNPRIIINALLLFIMAIIFCILTIYGTRQMQLASKNFQTINDSSALCFEEINTDETGYNTLSNVSICSTVIDKAGNNIHLTDSEDYTIFLYKQSTFASLINSRNQILIFSIIGTMLTMASLISSIVYWNHNKI